MRRLLYIATLSLVASLLFAPAALAQTPAEGDLYDCGDFTYQEDAQAQLLPGDPYGLDDDDDGMACDTLPSRGAGGDAGGAGGGAGGGGGGQAADVDCADVTFEEAQAILAADPTDPNRLDADNDGIACEVDDGATAPAAQTQYEPTPATAQYAAPADQYAAPADDTGALPATGGPALLLSAGVLLLGAGLLGLGLVRRS